MARKRDYSINIGEGIDSGKNGVAEKRIGISKCFQYLT